MSLPAIQVSAQFLGAGDGGIARCARLTLKALEGVARLSALAVEDRLSETIGGTVARPFRGARTAFVAANTMGALRSDWVIYDFAGTARAHGPLALAARPYALWAHGWEVWPGNLRPDYAGAIRGAKAVFANSAHTAARLAESLPDVSGVHVCPLGTEYDAQPPPGGSRERRVLFVGRSDEMFAKGQDRLIEAWPSVTALIPDAVLTFAGGGERLDRLRGLATASPAAGSIEVLGPLGEDEIAALYRRSRLLAMPSRVEGFGLVFAEAMSHGLPVLSGDADASSEVNLDGDTGFAVCRDNHAAIVARIVAVLRDEQLFARLSTSAYERWRAHYRFSAFQARFLRVAADAGILEATARAARAG